MCACKLVNLCVSDSIAFVCPFTEPAQLVDFQLGNIVSGVEGVKTVLMCVATGVPPPEITWHRSQEIMKPDGETSEAAGKYTSKFTLRTGEDAGEYSCTVKNKHSKPIKHTFAEPDHKPTTSE